MAQKVLTEGSKFAIATAKAKKMGFENFNRGSFGYAQRKQIAEGIAGKTKIIPGKAMRQAISRRMGKK